MSVFTAPWFYWSIIVAVGSAHRAGVAHRTAARAGAAAATSWPGRSDCCAPSSCRWGRCCCCWCRPPTSRWTRRRCAILSTVFGVLILIMVLSGVSATVFDSAPTGSWRRRMPAIFIDVARFAIIAVGVAMIFAYVWGANVGGLFTALGISSIVLGLTLQNSVGQIISGLLLLFEQPFQIGDWVETTSAKGRVVEVNWRATHINTGSGLEIIPNSVLAGQAFANLSRPPAVTPSPCRPSSPAPTRPTRCAPCSPTWRPISRICIPTASRPPTPTPAPTTPSRSRCGRPPTTSAARSTFQRWLWYAARRAGLRLDGLEDDFSTPKRRVDALRKIAPILRASSSELETLLPHVAVTRYGADEVMQRSGEVPSAMSFVVKGRVRLVVTGPGRGPGSGEHPARGRLHRPDGTDPRAGHRQRLCDRRGDDAADRPENVGAVGISQARIAPGPQPGDRRAPRTRPRGGRRSRRAAAAADSDAEMSSDLS